MCLSTARTLASVREPRGVMTTSESPDLVSTCPPDALLHLPVTPKVAKDEAEKDEVAEDTERACKSDRSS